VRSGKAAGGGTGKGGTTKGGIKKQFPPEDEIGQCIDAEGRVTHGDTLRDCRNRGGKLFVPNDNTNFENVEL
jgi:hypothetical protein